MNWLATVIAPLAAVGLTLLAWGGVLAGNFQYDDFPNLLNDPATAGGPALIERLLHGIRPLTRLTHVFDHHLWGTWAGGWLLGNLLLHALGVSGVYLIARQCGASALISALAAALFGLQPAHGMTIAYVSGRAGALMSVLLILALYCHIRTARNEKGVRNPFPWRAISLLLYSVALLAKETALCFPLLLLLWELTRVQGRLAWSGAIGAVVPSIVVTLVALALVLTSGRYQQLLSYSLALRAPIESLAHNALAMPATLSLLTRPWALSVLHELPAVAFLRWAYAAAGLAWILVAALTWRRSRWISFAMLWPVLALLPSHSFIAKADAVSESGLYLCWVGPCLALAMLTRDRTLSRWVAAAVMSTLVALAVTCTWRTAVWGDSVRLWREATQSVPASARAWNNLGMAYLKRDELPAARGAFDQALRIDPRHPSALYNRQLLDLVN